MSGMGRSELQVNNGPLIVSGFHHALATQAQILLAEAVLAVLALALAAWVGLILKDNRRGAGGASPDGERAARASGRREPAGRRALRIGFGLLWLLDGALQLQSQMPLNLPAGVVAPSAAGSPSWLRGLVRFGLAAWERHPEKAAAAVVFIQLGIALWLLLVAAGRWSRLGGLVSVGWGLTVWVFGESMGGMLAPGSSWTFGAPGAALFYVLAGALLALPERAWAGPRLGLRLLRGLGVFFLAMAVLQAWPGRGFWTGPGNALSRMVSEMAATPQPHGLARLLNDFAGFTTHDPVLVNAFVVCALAAIGAALLGGRVRAIRPALAGAAALCLADWVLVQDLGVFGGLGTDPNSAIPTLILLLSGYLALVRAPAAVAARPRARAALSPPPSRARAVSPPRPRAVARFAALAAACSITALGAVPLTVAAAQPNATTLLAQGIDGQGTPVPGELRPPEARLEDQHGAPVTFGALRGRVVLLTYLDPVCSSDCPVIAQEFRQVDGVLGGEARDVELVAIDANPLYRSPQVLRTFDRRQDLEGLPNWLYLTGELAQLRRVWNAFEVGVSVPGGGEMVVHADGAAILDREGRLRWLDNFDPGPETAGTKSSFAVTLADAARQVLRGS